MMDYWAESVDCALDEIGVFNSLTPGQRKKLADAMRFSAEMEGEATGRLCIPNPMEAELRRTKEAAAQKLVDVERRENIYRSSLARRLGIDPRRVCIINGQVDISRN